MKVVEKSCPAEPSSKEEVLIFRAFIEFSRENFGIDEFLAAPGCELKSFDHAFIRQE
ncbi:MAG: hypothetical protein ABH865_01980 [Candidatus Omnitrophota bacterium]|nr:hypothetical protein [Candidatus Omnitrophota bacterium]